MAGGTLSFQRGSFFCTTCDFPRWLFHFCVCTSPALGYTHTSPQQLRRSPAWGLRAGMALRGLALAFLLILAPLLPAQTQRNSGPKNQGGAKEAGKGGLQLSLRKKVLLLVSLHICYAALPRSSHSGRVGEGCSWCLDQS